jgi:hypothetical protein
LVFADAESEVGLVLGLDFDADQVAGRQFAQQVPPPVADAGQFNVHPMNVPRAGEQLQQDVAGLGEQILDCDVVVLHVRLPIECEPAGKFSGKMGTDHRNGSVPSFRIAMYSA